MADNLGEYKVVVTADYSQLQRQMKSIVGLMEASARKMSEALTIDLDVATTKVTHSFATMAIEIEQALDNAKGSCRELNGAISAVKFDGITNQSQQLSNSLKTASDSAEKLAKTSKSVGSTLKQAGDNAENSKKGFENYAKQIKELEQRAQELHMQMSSIKDDMAKGLNPNISNISSLNTLQQKFEQIRQQLERLKTAQQDYNNQIKAGELDAEKAIAKRKKLEGEFSREKALQYEQKARLAIDNQRAKEYKQEQARIEKEAREREKALQYEQRVNSAIAKQKEKDFAKEQAQINALSKQYATVYRNLQSYIQTSTQMSERQFYVMQSNLARLKAQMQAIGASPAFKNPLEGITYSEYAKQFDTISASMQKATKQAGWLADAMKSLKHHMMWMSSGIAFGAIVGIPVEAIRSIASVEKEMAGFKQVNHEANESQTVLNDTTSKFIGIAQRYGMSVEEIIQAGVLWGRGYKDINTVLQLTSVSAKLAVADMMDVSLANRAVESVINSFQKQGEAVKFANHVVDSWTKVAHNAQSSAKDLADALMRSAAAAKAVGVDFDTATALASTMIKTTGLAGATIGESMKSLFSSIHSKKAIQSLHELGIEVYKFDADGTRHFRNVQSVLLDLMTTSHTTSRNMEKDLLAISGGKFQWSKVASVLGDYKDFIHAYNLSIQSAGFNTGQIEAQLDTISKRFQQLRATVTGLFTNVGNGGLSAAIKSWIISVNNFIRAMQSIPASTYETIGSIIKWTVILGGSLKILKVISTSIVSVQKALVAMRTATIANTAKTTADTIAQVANNTAKQTGAVATSNGTMAISAETVAKEVNTVATTEATIATSAWATAMTVATAGINIIIAVLAVAVAGWAGYNVAVGESIEKTDQAKEALENHQEALQQEIEMSKQQEQFIETLGNQYIKLKEKIDSNTLSEQQNKKAKEDLEATEDELAQIVGEDGLQRIKSSKDVSQAIKAEQKTHREKTNQLRKDLANSLDSQIKYTESQNRAIEQRIKDLSTEVTAWRILNDTIVYVTRAIGSAFIKIGGMIETVGSKVKNLIPSFGNKLQDLGSSLVYKGIERINDSADYGYNGNDEKIAGLENQLAENRSKLAGLELRKNQMLSENVATDLSNMGEDENDSGELPYGASPEDSGNGRGTSKSAGISSAKHQVDNSPERMSYDFLMSNGNGVLSQNAILGLLGIMEQESGFNPLADDGDGHRGILQWDSNRWNDLVGYAQQMGASADDIATQLSFILYELQHSEAKAYQQVLDSKAQTPEQFADVLNKYYVRSGVDSWNEQVASRKFYNRFAEGTGGKKQYNDPAKQLKASYDSLKKLYEAEKEKGKAIATAKGQSWTALDDSLLWNRIMGNKGSNIVQTTGNSGIGALVAQNAMKFNTGDQWMGGVTSNPNIQCDSLTAEIYHEAGINAIGGISTDQANGKGVINDDAFRNAGALHSYTDVINGTYKPGQGDMLGWRWSASSGHYGIYDPEKNIVTTRDSRGGVQHRTLEQAIEAFSMPTWIGSLGEALKSPNSSYDHNLANYKFGGQDYFDKDNADIQNKALQILAELENLSQQREYTKHEAGVEWIHKLERNVDSIKNNGLPMPKEYAEIYKLKELSKTQAGISDVTKYASKEKMQTDIAEYEKIFALRQKAEKTAAKATKDHMQALSEMADKELEFAHKLGLFTDTDMLNMKMQRTQERYDKESGIQTAKLTQSAEIGKEDEMLREYNRLLLAETEQEAKQATERMMWLSKDINATSKAIEAKMSLDKKYYEAKYEYERQTFEMQNRYTISTVDTFVDSWREAFESTINRTRSFAENMQNIFKNMWQNVVKLFAEDSAKRLHKIISQAVYGNKSNGNAIGSMAGHMGLKPAIDTKGFTLSPLKYNWYFNREKLAGNNKMSDSLGDGLSLLKFGKKKKNNNYIFDNKMFEKSIKQAQRSFTGFSNTIKTSMNSTKQVCNTAVQNMMTTSVASDNVRATSAVTADGTIAASSASTQSTVIANIGAMVTQMLAAMAIMWAMSAIFGGGGGSRSSTSTSEVNLGRSPDSYYMTPSAVTQSTSFTVPSMDIGGNIEKDMLIYAHKNEMVLTPEQAGVIRSVASNGGINGNNNSSNAHVRSSINVSTVDSKGFDRVLRNYNRDLAKQVKKGIRNGYLNANGLV
jgi:TP901 family phage tail tape measure protein